MCRIVGFWDFNFKGEYSFEETIISMRDSMVHGGPDDAGLYVEKALGLALGHRRLSIIDLSHLGHQPMEFENLAIVYNGEVYNFLQIKDELEKYGYSFSSRSDTEVVLKAFHMWGPDCVHRFRGMFAFAIWDKKDKRLTLFRDRMGVKPLYWYYKDGLFMFSSELKAFHKHPKFQKSIDFRSLSLFLQYGYITSPYSIFENTYKLEPGHFLTLEKDGNIKTEKYWDVKRFFMKGQEEKDKWLKKKEEDLAEELESILVDSFKLRLVSDVPVGVFLSGGIDSSTVCALLSKEGFKLKTFTIGFYEKEYNEAEYAKRVAEYLGTDHTELYCTPKEAFEVIPKLPDLYDEPFGDSSAIPTYLVSKLARSKVKVSLSADGGDEQFCGYTRYWMVAHRIKKLNHFPFKGFITKAFDLLNPDLALKLYNTFSFILPKYTNFRDKYVKLKNVLNAKDLTSQYDLAVKYFLKEDIEMLGVKGFQDMLWKVKIDGFDDMTSLMFFDMKTYLPDDILVKVDRATMGVALEGREPLLDHKIVEWTSMLPSDFKYQKGKSKHLLRKVLYRYVPPELVERPKQGFGVPVYEWFKGELKYLYMEYLSEERIKQGGVFNHLEVKRLLEDYLNNRGVNHNKLWLLFIFEQWRERWG